MDNMQTMRVWAETRGVPWAEVEGKSQELFSVPVAELTRAQLNTLTAQWEPLTLRDILVRAAKMHGVELSNG